jgi:hypothetical protein
VPLGQAGPRLLEADRGSLGQVERLRQRVDRTGKRWPALWRRIRTIPGDPLEAAQDPDQLVVAELERSGGQEEHPREDPGQWAARADRLGVFLGALLREQRGEPRRVLEVMGLVEDQERRPEAGPTEPLSPEVVQRLAQSVADVLEPILDVSGFAERKPPEGGEDRAEIQLLHRLDKGGRDRIVLSGLLEAGPLDHSPPLLGRTGQQALPQPGSLPVDPLITKNAPGEFR